jgi:hypothetical protein
MDFMFTNLVIAVEMDQLQGRILIHPIVNMEGLIALNDMLEI